METKKFWKSKTLWLNLIAIVLFIVEYATQQSWMAISISGLVVGVLNMIVRLFLTNQGLTK